MNDIWPLVHAERRALIEDLEALTEDQWIQPSLCAGWTVHDVVAHLVDVAESTRLGFARDMVRAGFDFDRQNERGISRVKTTPAEAVERAIRQQVRTSTKFGGAKELVDGLKLQATDTDLTIGQGREIQATAIELLMACSGREKGPHLGGGLFPD